MTAALLPRCADDVLAVGSRSLEQISALLAERSGTPLARVRGDVAALADRLAADAVLVTVPA